MQEYSFTASKPAWPRGLLAAIVASAVLWGLSTAFYVSSNRFADFSCPSVIEAKPGAAVTIPVGVRNKGHSTMASSEQFFLSGKISMTGGAGETDLPRTAIDIPPGDVVESTIDFPAPTQTGSYDIRVDIVKGNEYWLADKGNRPAFVRLDVKDGH